MLPPASGGPPRQLVVILHGYGADGEDLIALGQVWRQVLPDALFIAPNAPEPCDGNPFGYQWFPLDLDRPASRLLGAPKARPLIEDFLKELWDQTGLGPAETVLAGFSQGAMMALHVGVQLDEPLAGIVAFSGALIPPRHYASRPPVRLFHGDLDTVVDPGLSRDALAALRAEGYDAALTLSPGIGHSISPEALEAATAFLVRVLKP
jgi:phospholipase/carboxylesterase